MLDTSKTFQKVVQEALEQFQPEYVQQPLIWQLIFYHSTKVKTVSDYLTHAFEQIDFDLAKFKWDLQKIFIQKTPLARITGKTNFYGEEFQVEDRVFIPRHETELVVDTTIKTLKAFGWTNGRYIDLCTGSGNIGLCIFKRFPGFVTTLIDLNPQAVYNAQENAERFGLKPKVVCGNWYDYLKDHPHEIITANFPYVSLEDHYDRELINHENPLSLFAEENGWEHYRQLIKYLSEDDHWKLVVLETSAYHKDKWLKLQSSNPSWNISFIEDLNHLFRVIKITRK